MRYFKRPNNAVYFPEDRSTPYCVEYLDGSKHYYSHNYNSHREDGPAYMNCKGYKSYYLNGKCYGNNDNYTDESWIRFCKLKAFQ